MRELFVTLNNRVTQILFVLRNSQGRVREVQLLQLRAPVPVGAAYVGAERAGIKVNRDYDSNTTKFHQEKI